MSSLISRKTHITIRWAALLIALTATLASLLQAANIKHVSADDGGYPWTASSGANCVDGTDCSQSYNWGYGLPCPSVDASCTTYYYPIGSAPPNSTAGMGDPWGYGVRNCTSYAAWKVNQVFGADIHGWGQAYQWSTNAPSNEVHAASGYTPQVGDIAQWTATQSNAYGHVAYVYAVNSGVASLAEYNSGYPKNGTSFQWGLFYNGFTSANYPTGGPNNYIHIGTLQTYHYQPIAGDFNADGLGDIGVRDSSNGTFYIKHGTAFSDQISYTWAAGSNYQPFVGDFNGDGYADIGLRDASIGVFYIEHGTAFSDQISYQWAQG